MFLPHWPPLNPKSGKIVEIMALLGNPQDRLPPVIHVAGTNGKGSIIAYLRNILKAHNIKAHSFTTPHILEFNENFIVAGEKANDGLLYENIEFIRDKIEGKIEIGFFEFQTALALLLFSKIDADFCLIECGLGARFDPTNIIKKKEISIISSISMDHKEVLGDGLDFIAYDKSFVMNGTKKLIIAPQENKAIEVIKAFAIEQKIEFFAYEESYDFDIDEGKFAFVDIDREEIEYYDLPSLRGNHQLINLAVALKALKEITSLVLKKDITNQAITNIKWQGRLEKFIYNLPLKGRAEALTQEEKSVEIYFDGCHNEGGAYSLYIWLLAQRKKRPKQKICIIYGRTAGARHQEFLENFLKLDNIKIIAITVQGEPTPEPNSAYQKYLIENPTDLMIIKDDLFDAMEYIQKNVETPLIVICGSLYLYRDLLGFLEC